MIELDIPCHVYPSDLVGMHTAQTWVTSWESVTRHPVFCVDDIIRLGIRMHTVTNQLQIYYSSQKYVTCLLTTYDRSKAAASSVF